MMKRSTKKFTLLALLICALVCAALAVALPAAAEAQEESFLGVSVSEKGDVSLNFYYSSLGNADSVAVKVCSPEGEIKSRYTVAKDDIVTDEEGRAVVCVRLAAVQMTDVVTVVTQKNGKDIGEEHTYSVRAYADRVLADFSNKSYHGAIRAMLNYGAMAQRHFGINTSAIANADIYRGNTNPINAVNDIECPDPEWTDGEKITLVGYEAFLENNTNFRFYFTYSGDSELSATVLRDGLDEQSTTVRYDEEEGRYFVRIADIAPTLYAEQYTVKVSDGEDTLTVKASLLNYADSLLNSSETTDSQKNAARAMYQHYVHLSGNYPDRTTCAHATVHKESSNNNTATAEVCSLCGAVIKKTGDSVEINGSASFIAEEYVKSDAEQVAEVLTDSDGTVFARIHGGRPKGGYNSLYVHASTSVECGKYVVMKLRTPTDNPTDMPETFYMFVKSTGEGADWQRVEFTAPHDGKWHTVVLDLTDFASKYTPKSDGKYYTQMLWIRPLTNGANVGTLDDVVDIAYISMCNEITDAMQIIDTPSYERHLSSTNFIEINSLTGKCFGKCLLEHTVDGAKHTYKCTVCGAVDKELTVDPSLNYYSAPGTIKAVSGDVYGSVTDGNAYYEDGEIFQRIDVLNGGGTIPLTAGGGADEKHIVGVSGSTGKYFVFRMRTHNIENVVGLSWRIGSAAEGETWTKPGSYICERKVFEDDVWTTYVVDIDTLGIPGYTTMSEEETRIVASFMVRADAASSGAKLTDTYIDVAYFAICDDWEEIDIATGDEKTVFLTEWRGEAELKEVGSGGSCPEGECVYELNTEEGIKYICKECRATVTINVDPSVNFYSAPGQTMNNSNTGYSDNSDPDWEHDIRYEDGRIYEHIELGKAASFKFDNGTGELCKRFPATSTISGGSGRYLVIKMRTHNIANKEAVRIMMNTDQSSQGNNYELIPKTSNTVLRNADFVDGKWQVYVIDLQKLGHEYYTAEDENVKKIAVGFYLPGLANDDNASMDVEYMAICDDWSEIDSVVGEKVVMLSGWANNEEWKAVAAKDGGIPVITEGEDPDKVIFEKKGQELYVYIRSPYAAKYTRYKYAYRKDTASSYEGWMIHSVAICDTNLDVLYYASRELSTDLEGAIQTYMSDGTTAAKDFVGGAHGDETYRTIKITVDGAELDMSRDYLLTACTSVIAVVESDVFRCETTEKIFDRTKTIRWSQEGMEIENSYDVLVDVKVERPAVGMLVVYRDDSGYKDTVTKHWDNISEKWIDVVWPEKPTANHSQQGMTYAELDGNYIKASLEIKDFGVNGIPTANKGWFNYDSWHVGNQRVKIYLDIFLRKELKAGDNMHCTAVHKVFAKE